MRLPISPAENTKNGNDTSLPPSAWTVTVLHHVSDVIPSNLKWRINPNSPAKLQKKYDIRKRFHGLSTLYFSNLLIISIHFLLLSNTWIIHLAHIQHTSGTSHPLLSHLPPSVVRPSSTSRPIGLRLTSASRSPFLRYFYDFLTIYLRFSPSFCPSLLRPQSVPNK